MKPLNVAYSLLVIMFAFLVTIMFVPDSKIISVRGGLYLYDLKLNIKEAFNIESNNVKEIYVQENIYLNNKTATIFDSFYDELVPRHAHAATTAYLGLGQEVGSLPYIFIANGDSFKVEGIPNQNGNYDSLIVVPLKNNLKDIINTNYFFENVPDDRHGVKDVTVTNSGDILLGHTDMNNEGTCTYASILWAPKPKDYELEFKQIFKTECTDLSLGQGHNTVAHMVGARVVHDEARNKLIFSVGMLNNFLLPQDDNSSYGKILEINFNKNELISNGINSPDVDFIAKGARNPQGLTVCGNNVVFSSHGPKGGDEVNFISLAYDTIPKNFGWPIASYGTHYDGTFGDDAPSYAPMYQDHTKYGFSESLIHYTPSVAPSQIISEPTGADNNCNNNFNLWLATMGYSDNPGQKSIHKYEISNIQGISKVINEEIFQFNGRIRDIENGSNKIWFWDETNSVLGYLNK